MQENVDFILWTAEEYRRHSDFISSISVLNTITQISMPTEFVYFRATLILNDIYIDLNDNRVFSTLKYLLDYAENHPLKDLYCKIHLYENAGWIYMNHGEKSKAEEYLVKALQIYKQIPFNTEKKSHYAHTLYIYSTILYQLKKYDLSREKLLISQKLICDTEIPTRSLSYSLGQKLMGWIYSKQNNYTQAESCFLEALSIQESICDDSFLYIVNTLKCLAENEIKLFRQSKNVNFLNKAKTHVQKAKKMYNGLDAKYTLNSRQLSLLEEKINIYYEDYM